MRENVPTGGEGEIAVIDSDDDWTVVYRDGRLHEQSHSYIGCASYLIDTFNGKAYKLFRGHWIDDASVLGDGAIDEKAFADLNNVKHLVEWDKLRV